MSEVLSGSAVRDLMLGVLSETVDAPNARVVKGIIYSYSFDMERLEPQRERVKLLLRQTVDGFHEGRGGGWSFLNFCEMRDSDDIWTGDQSMMEQLFCVGVALGLMAELPLPRNLCPGGVPYIVVKQEVWQ